MYSLHHVYVVLYRFSTSNHNFDVINLFCIKLYYIVSLHQTTTNKECKCFFKGCIISFLYIKPQHNVYEAVVSWVVLYRFSTLNHNLTIPSSLVEIVVLYRFSTSNHNRYYTIIIHRMLYYIVSLHQTTTSTAIALSGGLLYYIVSLHQTTTYCQMTSSANCCIISFLYIKPQRASVPRGSLDVVLYRFSTSNHNLILSPQFKIMLYYIVSLHQTTTHRRRLSLRDCCIISFLYIKPQRQFPPAACATVVLYRFSTSNHNLLSLLSTGIYVVLYRFSTSNHN